MGKLLTYRNSLDIKNIVIANCKEKDSKAIKNKTQIKVGENIDASIIIPCKNEVNTLKATVDSIINSKNITRYEIIVVDDASIDLSTEFLRADMNKHIYKDIILIRVDNVGCAVARNAGVKVAKGKYLFFCDAHIKVEDRWLDNMVSTLENNNADLVSPCIVDMSNPLAECYGGTWKDKFQFNWLLTKPKGITEIPMAGAAALGISKEIFKKISGFNDFFQVYGMEDQELCIKAWLYGYKLVVNPNVKVQHLFRIKHPYQITTANVIFNILCLSYCHFRKERIVKTIDIVKSSPFFDIASADIKLNMGLIMKEREKYFNERIYSDDFFFEKFSIPF